MRGTSRLPRHPGLLESRGRRCPMPGCPSLPGDREMVRHPAIIMGITPQPFPDGVLFRTHIPCRGILLVPGSTRAGPGKPICQPSPLLLRGEASQIPSNPGREKYHPSPIRKMTEFPSISIPSWSSLFLGRVPFARTTSWMRPLNLTLHSLQARRG